MNDASGQYSVAGILVRTSSADLPALIGRLSALAGVEVHHREPKTGRVVITLESEGADEQRRGLEEVREQTGVLSAELMYHYIAPPTGGGTPPAGPAGDS